LYIATFRKIKIEASDFQKDSIDQNGSLLFLNYKTVGVTDYLR